MKRTRRIEVIRYSRRVAVTRDESAVIDEAAGPQAGDSILDVLKEIPPNNESAEFGSSVAAPAGQPQPQRALFRLGKLLRLRGRK